MRDSIAMFAVAPMMDWTDTHCRYFMRLLSPSALLYTEMVTAAAIVHGEVQQRLSRRYSAGMISLRPSEDGQIFAYEGVEWLQDRYGEWIIDSHFPHPGTPTQPVDAGFMANAWVRLRHPDYDGLRGIMDEIGQTVKVYAR